MIILLESIIITVMKMALSTTVLQAVKWKIKIPKGRYAKFVIFGDPVKAVGEFWYKFWEEFGKEKSDIRNYTYDFEEYIAGNDYENTEIHIYISIK